MSGSSSHGLRRRPSARERESVAGRLREACADDRLSVETFATRLELAYAARTRAELSDLVSDLAGPPRVSRAVFAAVNAVSRWTHHLAAAWREPRTPRLALPPHDDVVLGRARECDCVLADTTVSRRHARLRFVEGRWWLDDLGSVNGTYLNGWRLLAPAEVRAGDLVAFGDARFVLAQLHEDEPAPGGGPR